MGDSGYMDAAAVPVPNAGDDTLRLEIEKVISQRCTHPGFFWSGGSCRECRSTADALLPLIREHVAAAWSEGFHAPNLSTNPYREVNR